MSARRLYLVAAEPSGDLLGREVAEAIRTSDPAIELAGIGGSEMAGAGLETPIDVSPLSVLGFFEGLKAYGDVIRLADEAAEAICAFSPHAVVLIDSWGFMLRVAQRLRKRAPDIRIIKLIGPQVWATRPGRARTLAACTDHLLCMHDFETPYYEPYGLRTTVIGNPALARFEKGDGAAFRERRRLNRTGQLLLVLPGSRRSEIQRVAPVLVEAARRLKQEQPELQVVFAPASSVAEQFQAAHPAVEDWAMLAIGAADRLDAMNAADLALACSGTVTTELAVQGTPMIVGYKTGWITWALARGLLYQRKHITLLNVVSDDAEIVPEYVQTRFTAENIAERAGAILSDEGERAALIRAQATALDRMGGTGVAAAETAAKAILNDLKGV